MKSRSHENILLVEGRDDKRVIPQLVEANGIRWGDRTEEWVADIHDYDGVESILAQNVIETEMLASGVRRLGVVVDADDDVTKRWRRIRAQIVSRFPNAPKQIPRGGAVLAGRVRFGAWLMPDNRSQGMLETLLALIASEGSDPESALVNYAQDVCVVAKSRGAPFKDAHVAKATVHTWLGWQDPPGRQLHDAIIQGILRARSEAAAPFIRWFRKVFEIDDVVRVAGVP